MVTTTDGDNRLVVFVAEVCRGRVVQVDGRLTADDAYGVFVGAFPVFAEPATFPGDPCRISPVVSTARVRVCSEYDRPEPSPSGPSPLPVDACQDVSSRSPAMAASRGGSPRR